VSDDRTQRLADGLARLLGRDVTDLERLSGGASRETWSFDSGGRGLILQRQRAGAGGPSVSMATEVALLRAAAAAGVPVPVVIADATDGTALGAPAFVVERLRGETIARKLLRDEQYAAVRPTVAGACGGIMAAIHRIPVDQVPGLTSSDPIESMRGTLDSLGEPHPAFEVALRWLDANRPEPRPPTVVHGDFRTGNLMVDPERVVAILDWELAHLGDPLEDLGWFCVRAWRFGADDQPAGGFGSREELWAAYEAAGGAPVDPEAARWWEIHGTLRWGVICMVQAASHLLGFNRSMELAAIGRRTCENEHDVLALLAPGRPTPAPTPPPAVPPAAGPHDRPTATELVEAVREWVEGDVADATTGRVRFHTRVASKALAMLERELLLGPAQAEAHAARLASLGVADDTELAAAIRAGRFDDRWDEALDATWAAAVDKLEVANPGYAAWPV
jgi:aminoglycoside phosphotransferase (APT) family kinase protein